MRNRSRVRGRAGFAVPLAVVLLVALALLTALFLEAALGEFRTDVALNTEARASAVAEAALAEAMSQRLDTAALHAPIGAVVAHATTNGTDSVSSTVQVLAAPMARVTSSVVVHARGVRAIAGRLAFVRMAATAEVGGEVSLTRLASLWWAPAP